MSLEKALELNTAAVTRLADLMERFKPNAAAATVAAKGLKVELDKIAEEPAPKKKAPVKKAEVKEELPPSGVNPDRVIEVKEEPKAEVKEEPKPEIVEEVKEVKLIDLQKVAQFLVIKGGEVKAEAKAAIGEIAGKGAKLSDLDKKFYPAVLAALESIKANLEEV